MAFVRGPRLVVAACMLAACAHWQRQPSPSAALQKHPDRILVTAQDSSQIVIVDPVLYDSTIAGLRGSIRGRTYLNDTVVVALSEIETIDTWYGGFEPLALVGLLAIIGVVFLTGGGW